MNHLNFRNLTLAILVLSLASVFVACNSDEGSGESGDFVLNLYTGSDVLNADSVSFNELIEQEDRPILLNFWAGACPPCRAEMPAIEQAWREYGEDVLVIGLDVGPYVGLGSFEQGKNLVDEFGITYVTGSTGNRKVVTDWQVASMPSTFFLDRDGRVSDIVIGAISSSRLNQKVQELISSNSG